MLGEILRLDALIADCLSETQKLKSTVVSLQQYEYAAQIREFEKQFEKIRENLSGLKYPVVPSKGLTRNGAIYSGQLFSYGFSRGWKNLPDYITNLFKSRKNDLNSIMEFSDGTTEYLIKFNLRLNNEELRITEFINALLAAYDEKKLETIIDEDFSYCGIVIQFLISKNITGSPGIEEITTPLYEIEKTLDDWIDKSRAYYNTIDISYDDQFLQLLPVALRDQKICYLFYYLGSNGLLALQDMLNIDRILVTAQSLCRLKRI